MWLVMFNHKEVRHDTRRILGDPDPLSGHKSWGRLCILFEKVPERRHPACPHRLCSRGHGGGIDMELADLGNVVGAALQRWHRVFCGRLQRDDGAGCGIGVTAGGLENEIYFGISENA